MIFFVLWLLLCAVAVVFFVYELFTSKDDWDEDFFASFGIWLIGTIGIIVVGAISHAIFSNYYTSAMYEKKWEIYSMSLNSNQTLSGGGFFLGWSIDGQSKMKYYYYVKGKRGLILQSTPSESVELNETDGQPMFIDSFEVRTPTYPMLTVLCDIPSEESCQKEHEYTINIPKDTIKLKFDVDQHSAK